MWRAYGPRYPGGHERWKAQREATLVAQRVSQKAEGRICEAPGCTRRMEARGLCSKHYGRLRATGYALGRQDPRWIAEHPPPTPPTHEQVLAECEAALSAYLDQIA